MRHVSYPQYAIVQGDTAQDLTDQLNKKLAELQADEPEVTFEGLIARIKYTEKVTHICEDLSDEYKLQGVNLHCEDCPYFEAQTKADGTPDMRKKGGICPICENGVTWRNRPACKALFNAINSGEVRLCFAE